MPDPLQIPVIFTSVPSTSPEIEKAFGIVFLNIRAFGKMFSGDIDPSKNLSGPIGIAQIFGSEWGLGKFLENCWVIINGFSVYEFASYTCS